MGWWQSKAAQKVTANGVRYSEMMNNFLWSKLEDVDVENMWVVHLKKNGSFAHVTCSRCRLVYKIE